MTHSKTMLTALQVSSGYDRKQVLHAVSLDIHSETITGLVGPNGSGKSTLLRVLAGSLPTWSGSVAYENLDITRQPTHWRARNGIGLLLPGGQVFSSMTVSDNLRLAQRLCNRVKNSANEVLDETFAIFRSLRDKASRRAGLLSGGERQMLAVALVLAQRPRVLLLDEPVEGLAQDIALEIMAVLRAYVREMPAAALLVEHNTTIVLESCEEVHFLAQGQVRATLSCSDADVEQHLTNLYFSH